MAQVCELVPSTRGHSKLVVDGFLMSKDKNRDDLYYWCCEKRKTLKCGGFASTILVDGEHRLRCTKEHNHAPEASRKDVAVARDNIKRKAHETRNMPAQIIQDETNAVPGPSQPAMPSRDALRQIIKRARKQDMPTQPTSLENIDVPLALRNIDNEVFLVKDSAFNDERILLFTTSSNVALLKESVNWIMDGTFKTVPTLFHQLYSIHAMVGTGENAKVLPLVYALMTSKSEECYIRLFQDLNDFAAENNHELNPQFILTDFEKAAINASKREFPDATSKGCLFHLGQSVWRRIQAASLSKRYGDDEEFSLILRHIVALAFLPASDIPTAFNELKPLIPDEASEVTEWFEDNYVHGRVRRTMRNGNVSRASPLFPPDFWSVFDQINLGIPRTQNRVEAWHRRFETLVGKSHVGVYTIIDEIRKEQIQVKRRAEDIIRGRAISPTRREYAEREKRISVILNDRTNRSNLSFLRGIAHNLGL